MLKIGHDVSIADLCPMCGDRLRNPNTSGIMRLYGADALPSAILWESEDLYLTPGPGTLMPGYLIVATRRHYMNFAEVPDTALGDLSGLVRAVSEIGATNALAPYLMFEHGSGKGPAKGASCVDHAHMHLAPCRDPDLIQKELEARFAGRALLGVADIRLLNGGEPYVFLHYDGRSYAYETPDIPCQFVRRLLAIEVGMPEQWNWFEHPCASNFWATQAQFKGMLPSRIQ